MRPGTAKELRAIIDAALRGQLDEASAHKLHAFGPEAVSLAALAMSRHIAKLVGKGGDAGPYTPALERVGLAGHSRGGKVAWKVLLVDASRATAIAGIDPVDSTGGPLGTQARVLKGPFNFSLPTLVIGTGLGGSCAPAGDNHEQFYTASVPPSWHIVVPGQGHGDMLDEEAAAAAAWLCPSGSNRMGMRRLPAGLITALFSASGQNDAIAYRHLRDIAYARISLQLDVNYQGRLRCVAYSGHIT